MSPEKAVPSPQILRGVFATETVTTVGFGATKRRVKQTVHIFAEETGEGTVTCRALSETYIPHGEPRTITKDELLHKFIPAPHIYLDKVLPALARIEKATDEADRLRGEGQLFTAEFEYKNVLRQDEDHIRASFGLGLTYLDRGETDSARIVFHKLSRLSGTFAPEYKHLFNEFGIKLRKNRMHTQALGHYAKALRLSPDDEHLLYNLARVLFEKGRLRSAKRFLEKALVARPDFPVARKFQEYMSSKMVEMIEDFEGPAVGTPPPASPKEGGQ
ncbi:tetratricopeptide repeat protein [Fundidesulfovibrio terrae]|uniref:tetratricopeptide repeat protein n=1 Tax=Fundidesulfovibrio terrae TaxID=2922866 RepID=UPI001FAFFDC8|nr:tetratricopeptide repeat protein [Fundidesulfovibrio terrae]